MTALGSNSHCFFKLTDTNQPDTGAGVDQLNPQPEADNHLDIGLRQS